MTPLQDWNEAQEIVVRVRFQETDAMGVVWHGNYLQYFEIGRTEWFRSIGLTLKDLQAQQLGFAVVHLAVDYSRPARFDDPIVIRTWRVQSPEASKMILSFQHEIIRGSETLAAGRVDLACLNEEGRIRRLPDGLLFLASAHPSMEYSHEAP